jgi:hypothetical protein
MKKSRCAYVKDSASLRMVSLLQQKEGKKYTIRKRKTIKKIKPNGKGRNNGKYEYMAIK